MLKYTTSDAAGLLIHRIEKEEQPTTTIWRYFYMNKNEKKNLINALIMFGEQNSWIYR